MFTNGIERFKRVIVYSVVAGLMIWITAIIIGCETKKAKSCYCNAAYAEDTRILTTRALSRISDLETRVSDLEYR